MNGAIFFCAYVGKAIWITYPGFKNVVSVDVACENPGDEIG